MSSSSPPEPEPVTAYAATIRVPGVNVESGGMGNAIVVVAHEGGGLNQLTGSHQLAAPPAAAGLVDEHVWVMAVGHGVLRLWWRK